MRPVRIASLFPFQAEKKRWHMAGPVVFVVFVLAIQIASLMSPDYIWDDLVWYWTYRVNGTEALFHFLNQVGHPSFWPFLDFAYRAFGAHATLPTTVIALIFHAASAILLWRLMSFIGTGRIPSFLACVFYLSSPYYFNRGTVSHYFYDIFMFLWLFSVYLGAPHWEGRFRRLFIAPVFQILSFGLPTLIMLEPFRLMVYRGLCGRDYRKLAISVGPYWLVASICAIAGYIVFKPSGYYEGYNQLNFSPMHILEGVFDYVLFLPKVFYFHAENAFFILRQPFDWPLVILSAAIALAVARMMPASETKPGSRNTSLLLLMTVLLFLMGAAPYILAGRSPAPGEFNSRLFYVSGFGCVVMASIMLAKIPSARGRFLIVSGLITLFLMSGFQQGKSYMYDYLVRQTVLSQLRSNVPKLGKGDMARQDMFIGLTAEPPFWELSVQNRLYSPAEFSVPLNFEMQPEHGKWFVYYLDYRYFFPPDYILPPRDCAFAAHDRRPCPAYYVLTEYKVNVKESGITNFSFLRLFSESFLADKPVEIGHLVFLAEPKPMNINAMAARWFRKLAEEGDAAAQNKLGLMYLNGFSDIQRDNGRAFEWFQKSAAQGDLDGRLNVGLMYLQGRGVEKDDEVAAQLIYSAAKEGNATAQYNYGFLCEMGLGVAKSETEAFAWYLKAAEQDQLLAQSRVGLMYARGTGTSRSMAAAVRWLRKAADKNDRNAQYALATMFSEGDGISRDIQAAISLFRKSADQGFSPAQFSLGVLYQHGVGVRRDDHESYFWYQLAARYAETSRQREIAEQAGRSFAKLIIEHDRKELNERVRNWRPQQPEQSPAWDN